MQLIQSKSSLTQYLHLTHNRLILCIAGIALCLLSLISGIICPVVQPSSAFAETTAETNTNTSGDSTISITIPSAVNIDITPDFNSTTFSTASADISVTTTGSFGYSLSLGTSGTDANDAATTALTHTTKSEHTIPSIATATTETNFPLNAWGYTTDNNGSNTSTGQITAGTYQPLTTTTAGSTLIKKTAAAASNDSTIVTFAVKTDSSLPSGEYTNTVIFSVVANLVPEDDLLFWGSTDNSANTTTTLIDKSGNGNNGTLYNFDDTTSSGWNDNELVFDGVDDYVNIGLAGYDFNNSISYVAYVEMLSVSTSYNPMVIGNLDMNGLALICAGQSHITTYGYNGTTYLEAKASASLSTYHVFVGTFDGSNLKTYIDGTLAATTASSTVTNSPEPILLGANPYNGVAVSEWANMSLREALVYDRALTADEVQTITANLQDKWG